MKKLIAMDIGSSAIKTCAFGLDQEIQLLYSGVRNIGLYSPKPGYAEHDPEEVWEALCQSIQDIFKNSDISKEEIELVSICSQAQCVVVVDRDGKALTPIYNSQDGRAVDSFCKYYGDGITVADLNILKVAGCFLSAGFFPGSAKDPVFKFKWVQDHMPEIYDRAYKWLDIKDYIIGRLTGEYLTTKDNAHAYTIYNSRENKGNWAKLSSKIFKVDQEMLPKVIESTDIVGTISPEIAEQTGLQIGTSVIGGVIDSTGVQYGSGAVGVGEAMVYWGTSGWVGSVTNRLLVDPICKTGSLLTAESGMYHHYACLDSAGISYKWMKEHLVEDDRLCRERTENPLTETEIYEKMNQAISQIPVGSDGLMFAPWITGCRAPMEASDIGGMFMNIKNSMDKRHLVRATVEGICYHYRLLRDTTWKIVRVTDKVRFVGGGANSDEIAQILADIMGCIVEVPENPQDVGAYGAAMIGFYALAKDQFSFVEMAHKQKAVRTFTPKPENQNLYNQYYQVYKKLYGKNKKILSKLTKIAEKEGL